MTETSWTRLIDHDGGSFYAGTVFRFPARWPYEDIVDLMLFCDNSTKIPELRLVVTTGRKAGFVNLFACFPAQALVAGTLSVCPTWLQANWTEWVYDACEVQDVWVTPRYATPQALPSH